MAELQRKLRAVKRRLRLFRLLDWGSLAALVGLVVSCVALLGLRLVPNALDPLAAVGVIAGAFVALAAVAALLKPITDFEAAVYADSKLALNERLSSALLLAGGTAGQPAFAALEDDARRHADAIRPGRDFHYQAPPHARHVVWPLAVLLGLYLLMPQLDIFGAGQAQAKNPDIAKQSLPEEVAKEESRRLRELAKEVRESDTSDAEGEDLQLSEKLERLSRDLSINEKDKKELVAEMSRLSDEVQMRKKDLTKRTQPFRQIKGLQQADKTRDIQQSLKEQDFESAEEKMQQLAQMFANPEDVDSKDMEKLAEELEQLSQELDENKNLSEALKKAAEAVQQAAEQKQQQEQQQSEQGDQGQQEQGGQQQKNDQGSQQQEGSQSQSESGQPNQQGQQQSQSQSGQQQQQQMQQAAQQAQAALQQAASQMQDMQQLQQQLDMLNQLQSQLSQSQSECMNPSSSQSGKASQQSQSQSGQQASPQGSPSGRPQGNPQQCDGKGGNCNNPGCGSCNGEGAGPWQEGSSEGESKGSGGPGRGEGGSPPDDGSMAMAFEDVFITGQKNEGEIIAVFEIDAPAATGESTIGYSRVPTEYKQQAADAMKSSEIPAGYRNAVRDYFESINFTKPE